MRVFWFLWKKLANLRLIWRALLKIVILGCVLFAVLYPNPVLFFKQIQNFLDMESLIQTNFNEIDVINREIDAVLPPDADREQELHTIQHYVYEHIRYEYDWENWGNIDFWPSAEQVWERKKEDCDGRAVLAVSILRSRGFESAKLVGNIRHIWVDVDQYELMGPDKEQTLKSEGGRPVITLPSRDLMLNSAALHIAEFPAIRNLIVLLTLLLLCYHPCRNLTGFFGITTMGLIGFILLRDWAKELRIDNIIHINFDCIGGFSLTCTAIILSLLMQKIVKRET
jgi:hypothetical protein